MPSAFTAYTGAAHWEVLLRARAVENGCFVVAPGPGRRAPAGAGLLRPQPRSSTPGATVLAERPEGVGICVADLDLGRVDEVRAQLPSLQGRRPDAYGL